MYVLHSFCLIETCGILEGYSIHAASLHCEVSGELEAELPYFLLYLFLKRSVVPICNATAHSGIWGAASASDDSI